MLYLLLILSSWMTWSPQTPVVDYCELKGQVFIERKAAFADYKVYIEPTEDFADLYIYKEDVAHFATENGSWYITEVKANADFSIYLEASPDFADFSIFYTSFRADAGCP